MITKERIEEILEDRSPFKNKDDDHDVVAINLLREKIPYEVCRGVISGADHDIIYLCDVEECLPYLSEEDIEILADCNVFIHEDIDCFALFV